MEQNYNEQNPYVQNQTPVTPNPYNDQSYNPQPVSPYPAQPRPEDIPGLQQLVNSAFGKALASVIMAELPIASIIAIFMGSSANKLVAKAENLAAQYGTKAGGKKIAAKIMGKIGFFMGIGMTIFWGIYILYFIFLMLLVLVAETNYHF